ncbi:MAG: aminotransferase class I/II-fold pyridoxal phosphate-dependent enzyme [Chloroflexota bacterium]
MPRMAQRVAGFGTTIFTQINMLARERGAVNLGQGAPDFDGSPEVLAAAVAAINSQMNQYAPGLGLPKVKEAVALHVERFYGQKVDPVEEVVITSGATEAMFAAILGLSDPGDEIIVFEPVYDSYVPNMQMAGVTPRYVSLRPPTWDFDPDELAAAFTPRTRAIIINTPHNPTGKVYSHAELSLIAELCQRHDVIAITDEVYEHILYDGAIHTHLACLPGMEDRTLTISSLGKTFSVTGWKIGWAIGNRELVAGLNRAHQFITFAVASPLQAAASTALSLPSTYYEELQATYQGKRDYLLGALREAGFKALNQQGGYFIMADWREVAPAHITNDVQFAEWLISEVGVACIPPSAFYRESTAQTVQHLARFAVCKKDETLQAAVERFHTFKSQR